MIDSLIEPEVNGDIGEIIDTFDEYRDYYEKNFSHYVIYFWFQKINTRGKYMPGTYRTNTWDDHLYDPHGYKEKTFMFIFDYDQLRENYVE